MLNPGHIFNLSTKIFLIFSLCIIGGFQILASNSIHEKLVVGTDVILWIEQTPLQDINTVIVPFELLDGLVVVKARVDGHAVGNFIIDTGAGGLVLNARYYTMKPFMSLQATGLNGDIEEATRSRADSLSLDALNFTKVIADITDLSNIESKKSTKLDGLIGYDLLRDFEIQINYFQRFLTLSRTNKKGEIIDIMDHTRDKIDSFKLEMAQHLPVIKVKVNNIEKKMGIDTGAEVNLLDNHRNDDILIHFKPVKIATLAGSENKDKEFVAGRLYKVSLASFKCGAMATALVDMKNLDKIYKTRLDGIVGYNFLGPWVFSINYKKKMLYLHSSKILRP